ncbi:HAL/PAL/TAL family ammonia-lyase [Persicimonas caeni]|nr:aromatic amino acid ammonia-lyase [Persicimonas caeni]
MSRALALDPHHSVTVQQAIDVVRGRRRVELSPAARERMLASRELLDRMVAEKRRVYGVTTGYGPLATQYIDPAQSAELQRKLIYHLATGVGEPFAPVYVRALMFARAVSLSRGASAVRPRAVELILDCLEHDILPVIPSLGTVGASGDLTPLAHMALALLGEADVMYDGQRRPAAEVFDEVGLEPLDIAHKEGLGLVNGTSAMTGLALVNQTDTDRAFDLALRLAVLYAELLEGRREAWDPLLGRLRPHPGQGSVHERLMALSASSARLQPIPDEPARLDLAGDGPVDHGRDLPQDAYTLRCIPQLFGAVLDTLDFHGQTVARELDSVTDNPVFDVENGRVVHGGNFYGQHISFASDALSNAIIKLAVHAERAVARVTDPTLNGGLPAFMQGNHTGLNSGFMGAQVTASALIAEMRTKSSPASIQSVPTNANNQDVVTMGTISALRASQLLERLYEVLAIEAMVLVQGFELVGGFERDDFCESSQNIAHWVRARSAFVDEDRSLSAEIQSLAKALKTTPTIP